MLETNKILELLKKQVIELDKQSVVASIKKALKNGIDAYSILTTLSIGMKGIGEKFQTKEYYISDLIMAGHVMKSGVAVLEPHLKSDSTQASGIIVLGTVKGDIHDIGKNIFGNLVQSAGFKVIDLGLDVDAEKFVNATRKHNPNIVGISALLTTTLANIPEVIKAFEESGLRKNIKIILGGAPITDTFAKEIGADFGVNDATIGVNVCEKLMEKHERI